MIPPNRTRPALKVFANLISWFSTGVVILRFILSFGDPQLPLHWILGITERTLPILPRDQLKIVGIQILYREVRSDKFTVGIRVNPSLLPPHVVNH